MHTDLIWQMALERQAGFRADARRTSTARRARRRHELPVADPEALLAERSAGRT